VFEQCLRVHIYPHLGQLRMSAVSRTHVKSLVTLWSRRDAPRTVRLRYAVLAALFSAAALDRTVSESPCVDIKLPEIPKELIVPLSVTQVLALHDAIDSRFRPAVLLGAGCGARVSEALGFTKPRVLFLRREVLFAKQVSAKPPWRLVDLKTKSSRGSVPAPPFVLDALAPLCAHPGPGGLLFVRDGGPVPANALHTAMRKAVRTAGLPQGTTFHDLRHHYASTLIDGGASPVVVAARLRHGSASEVWQDYAHLFPQDDERTLRILGQAWARADVYKPVSPAAESG
jgi:integrase